VLAPQLPFGVFSDHRDQDLYATRIAANAARAIGLGLGRMRSTDPPPLYAFDRDTGRLAVTTARYSTAIVPDNHGAFDYGGIELARLFGPGQRVAASIGGEPPNAFGVTVADAAGSELLASQRARLRRGRLSLHRALPRGSFRRLEAVGTIRRGNLRITTTHRFRHDGIDERWVVGCRGGCGPYTVDVNLPTWGASTAIDAIHRDGTRVRVQPGQAIPLAGVERIELGGYTARPTLRTPGAVLVAIATVPQGTDPDPGPTLAIRLVAGTTLTATTLALRLTPAGRQGLTLLTENETPCGSASTAVLPTGASNGPATGLPPSSAAFATVASTSSTQKSALQYGGASPLAGAMTATTSRETGCSGSPPT
jgi:hypothetical protein